MAAEIGTPNLDLRGSPVEAALREDPQSFGFFQAVRLLQRLRPEGERAPFAEIKDPAQEVVRLSVNPSLGFPAGEIQDLELEVDGPSRMQTNFMGLVGHMGVMPMNYTLLVNEETRSDDRPLTDFLNIFEHRILSLFYKAWERSHFYVQFERGEADPITSHLMDLIGLGSPTVQNRMDVRDEAFLFYSGLLGMRQRSAIALEQLLGDYFGVPVEVQQFAGGWYRLSEDAQCRVDDDPPPDAVGLGHGVVLGDEIWDSQSRVRIRVGPLERERYEEFLPGREANAELRTITKFYGDGQFDFELQLLLEEEDVPGVVLGAEEDEAPPLGWCTWIRTRPMGRVADETTLTL